MGFFEGFLGEFARTGGEILQEKDKLRQEEESKIRQLAAVSAFNVNENRQKLLDEAALLQQQEQEYLQSRQGGMTSPVMGDTPVMPLQQTGEDEIVIGDDAGSSAFTFSGTTPTTTQTQPILPSPTTGDALSGMPELTPDEVLTLARAEKITPRQAEAKLLRESNKELRKEQREVNRETRREEVKKKEAVTEAWDKVRTNDKEPLYKLLQFGENASAKMQLVKDARRANIEENVQSEARALGRAVLPNISTNAKALEKIGAEEWKLMTSVAKGATTENENKYFIAQGPGPNELWTTNESRLNAMEVGYARGEQLAAFVARAEELGIRPAKAQKIWNQYLRQQDKTNPTLKLNKSTGVLDLQRNYDDITSDESWRDFLENGADNLTTTSVPGSNTTTDFTSPVKNNTGLTLEDLIK